MKKIYASIIGLFLLLAFTGCEKDNGSDHFFDNTNNGAGGSAGTGGSLARFIIVNDHLYVVDNNTLSTFDLNNGALPKEKDKQEIGFNIETIFNLDDKLIIGSQSAMYIYDISNPNKPKYTSSIGHFRACDPVVANRQYAYLTLRSNDINPTACGGSLNALMVYNIEQIETPTLLNTITLENPHGLALYQNTLYVCESKYGLKVFDLTEDPTLPQFIKNISNEGDTDIFIDCFTKDIYLYAMMDNGFKIYDISEPLNPKFVGSWLK